jgi:hypothetical protein
VNLIVDVKDTLDVCNVDEVLQSYYKGKREHRLHQCLKYNYICFIAYVVSCVVALFAYHENRCFAAMAYVCMHRHITCDLEGLYVQTIVTVATRGGTHPCVEDQR